MKKLITKYWGVVLVVVLLSTLFVGAVPVSNAATLAWSLTGMPNPPLSNQIANGTNLVGLTVASNGDLFAVDNQTASATINRVYKSTTGGRTWTASLALPGIGGFGNGIVAIATSPNYSVDGYVLAVASAAATSQVYISVNGGLSFTVLGGTIAGRATSIAIAPNYNAGAGEIMVGTLDATATAGDVTLGSVFFWGYAGTLNWSSSGGGVITPLGADVTTVAYSQNYSIDATRLAIGSTAAAGTIVHTLVAADLTWDATLATPTVIDATVVDFFAAANSIQTSAVAFPSDYNASSPFSRTFYGKITVAGATTATKDNVYRLNTGTGALAAGVVALNPLALFLAVNTVTSISYSGTTAAGTLFAGASASANVVYSTNPQAAGPVVAWIPNTKGPSGASGTYVKVANDFATSMKVYASTSDAAANGNSAVSASTDGGNIYNGIGAIDTVIGAAGINDFQAVDANTWFLFTNDGLGTGDSLWKTTDAGATWMRVLNVIAAANTAAIRISPNYATDHTVLYVNLGSGAAGNIQLSNNGGSSWAGRTSPLAPADLVIKDQYTWYVGSSAAATTQSTANGGWTWQAAPTTVAGASTVSDMALDLSTGALLVGLANGTVLLSTNNNVLYIPQGLAVGAAAVVVAFDANYATNGFIYAANSAVGVAGVFRFAPGYTAWLNTGVSVVAGAARSLVATADGALYVNDVTGLSGMFRSINPTAGIPTFNTAVWTGAAIAAPPAGANPTLSLMSAVGNTIYAVDNTANLAIWTYNDTLTTAVPVVTAPAADVVLNNAAAFVAITPVTGALAHQVQWDTRPDFLAGAGGAAYAIPAFVNTVQFTVGGAAPAAATLPPAGATIYYRVRVSAPLVGPWSQVASFKTELTPIVPNAPAFLGNGNPTEGSTNPGGFNVAVVPTFAWGAIGGATGYKFQLATNAEMTELLVDETLPATTAYKLFGHTLKYSSTYYWRVQGVSATSNTQWSNVAAFTTMDEPVVTTPVETTQAPVITPIINLPAPIVNLPATTTVTKEINPTYIWAIIVIGAVLVLAVIVLIVRTRRSV